MVPNNEDDPEVEDLDALAKIERRKMSTSRARQIIIVGLVLLAGLALLVMLKLR